jgi:hypothetical protein
MCVSIARRRAPVRVMLRFAISPSTNERELCVYGRFFVVEKMNRLIEKFISLSRDKQARRRGSRKMD